MRRLGAAFEFGTMQAAETLGIRQATKAATSRRTPNLRSWPARTEFFSSLLKGF